jgi:two-component system chemotaxis sensor kinase CheA
MNDLQQFKDTYITECFELLAEMETKLLDLDGDNASNDDLNAIFRCAHSIKGGAGAFGFDAISSFTHVLEALLDAMREGEIGVSTEVVDALLKARDVVETMVMAARDGAELEPDFGDDVLADLKSFGAGCPAAGASSTNGNEKEEGGEATYTVTFKPHPEMIAHGNEPLLLIRELKGLGKANVEVNAENIPLMDAIEFDHCYLGWTITLTTEEPQSAIEEVFEFVDTECDLNVSKVKTVKTSETIPAKATKTQASKPIEAKAPPAAAGNAPAPTGTTSIRVDIDKVDRLINMVGEVVITQAMIAAQSNELPPQQFSMLLRGVEELSQHTRELQEAVMSIRMQPVKSIFSRMPRLIRDLSAQLDKEITLEMSGENTEVDKTIIEQLTDPLTHMIRNSADHGIEMPDDREAAGKPRQGTVLLSAEHRGGRIVIEIKDDGSGINRQKVLKKAKEKGVVSTDATLSDNEIDHLIFAPGFSTAEVVSNVSGRGVGMDVVKRNIESLGGTVIVENTPGEGSVFAISLPLTLAILDGMIVRVGEEYYIVPINNIIETLRPRPEEVHWIADGRSVINVRGEFIPLLFLCRLFGIEGSESDPSKALVVLVESGNDTVGLVVDELVGQQQVVIKSLEENSDPIEGVSGATILGDGKVSLILDIAGLGKIVHPPDPDDIDRLKIAA